MKISIQCIGDKMKLGIPKGFLYQRKKVLWGTFFNNLDIPVVISEESTSKTLIDGKKYANSEDCLPYKLYLGQIASLVNKCEKILIPRVDYLTPKDTTCAKYQGIYDVVHTLFPNVQFLDYNIDIINNKTEQQELLRIGKELGKQPKEIENSYQKAIQQAAISEQEEFLLQEQKLKTNKPKVLIVAHDYELQDAWISSKIINILKKLDVEIIDANKFPKANSLKLAEQNSNNLYWLFQKELLGAYQYYYNKVDGVLFISCFPCGCDALFFEKLLRETPIPAINLVIDEQNESGGIETRLESFVDIIKEKVK